MWKVFYPNNPTQPYATNVYDPLGRVMRQTNAAGQVYDYYYSYYRTEELEPPQTPPGGSAARYSKVYYFDDHGQTVAAQDQLGRKTTTEYDGQQRPQRVRGEPDRQGRHPPPRHLVAQGDVYRRSAIGDAHGRGAGRADCGTPGRSEGRVAGRPDGPDDTTRFPPRPRCARPRGNVPTPSHPGPQRRAALPRASGFPPERPKCRRSR